MPRLIFEKTGNAAWISHLDLMRLFQRAFKRAGLPLKHTQGYNPRPSVSIALPLSVGVESKCELLDFELDTAEIVSNQQIVERLNKALINGVCILDCYDNGGSIRDIAFLRCSVIMEYDRGCADAVEHLEIMLAGESIVVPKKTKNGIQDQDIIPLIKEHSIVSQDGHTLRLDLIICCQNPSLNPMQIVEAIRIHKPDLTPDFTKICRHGLYNKQMVEFK